MFDFVLQRLETLQAELASLDPGCEVNATDQVAAMANALRDVLGAAHKGANQGADRFQQPGLQALAG